MADKVHLLTAQVTRLPVERHSYLGATIDGKEHVGWLGVGSDDVVGYPPARLRFRD
jgi:hypothetical protein